MTDTEAVIAKLREAAEMAPLDRWQGRRGYVVTLSEASSIIREAIGEAEGGATELTMQRLRVVALEAELAAEREAHRKAIEGLARAVGRFQSLRNNIIGTQSASWANTVYPMVAILTELGLDYEPPADHLKLDHKQCYGGAGRMPDPDPLAALSPPPTPGEREPICARFGGRPTCPEAEEFYCRVHCYHEKPVAAPEPVPNPLPKEAT